MTEPKQLAEQVCNESYTGEEITVNELSLALSAIEARDREFVDLICFLVREISEAGYSDTESEQMNRALKMLSFGLLASNPALQSQFEANSYPEPSKVN